ncbi:FtsW/RodA/SpoVE family cell cycle protein [Anaerosalibacter sp. Marseille-P3206]|uniref:FtsW/RodA/SpoVE family cell cycle protein n=1 Tax=Anaerosalibacter sp. Marseille-P3206 TaxID=1871005 RepID=UPI000986FABB|nr:FtsW/RodA/SpoVE family cell cycle protein [Anaerosalibacter sp. Marseille-P3206]
MDLLDNQKVNIYMDTVCSCVKFREAHNEIRREIETHLIDTVEEHEKEGISREEAIDMTIKQMGDPLDLGRKLNEVHRPKPEWSVLTLVFIFLTIGMAIIYTRNSGLFQRSLFGVLAGIVVMVLLYFFNYQRFKPLSKYIYLATTILLLTDIRVIINSGFDIAYIAPIVYALSLSGMFSDDEWKKRKGIINLAIFILPMAVLLYRNSWSSLVSVAMYFVVALVIATMSGINIKYILGVAVLTIATGLYSIFNVDYRAQRILMFLNPEVDAQGAGYINVQLKKILTSAGLFGNGFDIDKDLTFTLPEMNTDFVFSYIVYTLGWIVGAIIISLIIVFFIRLIKTSKSIKNSYGRLIVASFTSIFIVQFSYNILMIFGLVPLAGFSLPFISYGSRLNIANMAMIGIISSVYRRKNILLER